MYNVLGLDFARALILVTKVEYCFLSMYIWVENRLNPLQNSHSMSLNHSNEILLNIHSAKNADYSIFSGIIAFHSLSQ